MKKQPKQLFEKSLDSLVLSIEHFNRPWDRGRHEAVLILLDRAFELLLKSIILHKGGKIREPYEKETIGFEKCVRKCITDQQVKCLGEEDGLTIQIINSFRDAAQHDIVILSEQELYMYSQAGVTLYKDLIKKVFGEDLRSHLPERILPISTHPPADLHSMVEADFKQIKSLLKPKSRKQIDAKARLKSLVIIESSLEGIRNQPSELEINKLAKRIQTGKKWRDLFPGIASLNIVTTGSGISVDIRITKKEGDSVRLVPEGTPGATVLAVKRVNELDYYSLGLKDIAQKIDLGANKTLAIVKHLKLQESGDYYKEVKVGKSKFKRYSAGALNKIKKAIPKLDISEVWEMYKPGKKKS
ncbi:MAG: hypothetical protein KZQ92_21070 [Candidatus Thiodiazotropha sp. (ex Lucinoma borealis)]|nr:hypothetical protein [Candidatus Thiodiazotropha sp. (ex Lucinoma borealis)]